MNTRENLTECGMNLDKIVLDLENIRMIVPVLGDYIDEAIEQIQRAETVICLAEDTVDENSEIPEIFSVTEKE